jgi:hypothetical protein
VIGLNWFEIFENKGNSESGFFYGLHTVGRGELSEGIGAFERLVYSKEGEKCFEYRKSRHLVYKGLVLVGGDDCVFFWLWGRWGSGRR